MNLIDKFLKKADKTEIKLQQGVNTVQSIIEESESQKEASIKAVDAVVTKIEKDPKMQEVEVAKLLNKLQKETDLSVSDLVKIIKQLPDVKSEETTVAAVEAIDLPSSKIVEIIEDSSISPHAAKKIAEQIPDKDIQKEQQYKINKTLEEAQKQQSIEAEKILLNKLSDFYTNCDSIEDTDLVQQVQKLNIDPASVTPNVKLKLIDIIAKRTAIDCMKYGGPKILTLSRIASPHYDMVVDMFEADLPLLVQQEYKSIQLEYDEHQKDYHSFGANQKNFIKEQLLDCIAKKSAITFDEIGDFNIPKIKQFAQLNKNEINYFVSKVNLFSKEKLDSSDEKMLIRELNGESALEMQNLHKMLEKMDSKSRDITIQKISDLLKENTNSKKSSEQIEIDKNMEYIHLKIKQLPIQQQLIATKAICNALDEQQEALKMMKKSKETSRSNEDEFER